jgi:X-X-X-Leu-X-X-Gly heptad repeat protein
MLTKKERIKLDRERETLEKNLSGIKNMSRLPDALFIIDVRKEEIAVAEANRLGIPVIAVVDTNCSPEGIDYVIPGNDDALRAVRLFASRIADAVVEGQQLRKEGAEGADEAAAGAAELADGNRQIADGASELADGLGTAADGAGELADGSAEAAEGTPALVDGIGEVQGGVGQLKAGGEDTVETYAPNVAVLQAATARGAAEAMPYGAPEGAVGTAAYSITLAGEAGEGGQNLVKALAAVVILGLAAGGVALARRRATG